MKQMTIIISHPRAMKNDINTLMVDYYFTTSAIGDIVKHALWEAKKGKYRVNVKELSNDELYSLYDKDSVVEHHSLQSLITHVEGLKLYEHVRNIVSTKIDTQTICYRVATLPNYLQICDIVYKDDCRGEHTFFRVKTLDGHSPDIDIVSEFGCMKASNGAYYFRGNWKLWSIKRAYCTQWTAVQYQDVYKHDYQEEDVEI